MLTSIPEESQTELCGQVFIATRFNVVYTEAHFSKDKSGNATRTEAWLSRRFELFEQVCLPSLIAQSDQAFEWLIFLSDSTPASYKDRMERYRQQFPQLVPVYCRDGEYVVGRFQAEVRERLKPSATHAITLRIDNDDAFHRGMVRRARAELRDQQDEIINFLRGIQCAIDQGIAVQVSEKSNPFIVRIERIRPEATVRTVMDVMHHEAAQSGLLRDVDTEPMWLQSIHGGNVTNAIDSGRYLFAFDPADGFSMRYPFRLDRVRTFRELLAMVAIHKPMRLARRLARRLSG